MLGVGHNRVEVARQVLVEEAGVVLEHLDRSLVPHLDQQHGGLALVLVSVADQVLHLEGVVGVRVEAEVVNFLREPVDRLLLRRCLPRVAGNQAPLEEAG